ncbi:MAG: hypothetical protein AAGM67_21075, partial [Bacteroidota bacterium]
MESLALPYESYQAAFSEKQIETLFIKEGMDKEKMAAGGYLSHKELTNGNEGGANSENQETSYWWIPSGQQSFEPEHFFVSQEARDPFGNTSRVSYDKCYLLIESATDAVGNIVESVNDYITLQPSLVKDLNGNGSKVAFDALGLVAGSGVMGKLDEDYFTLLAGQPGDPLLKFQAIWEYDKLYTLIDNPYAQNGLTYLQDASIAVLYDLWRYIRLKGNASGPEPPVVYSLVREHHTLNAPDYTAEFLQNGEGEKVHRRTCFFFG